MNYIPPVSPEEKRFSAHMAELADRASHSGRPVFTPFLDLRERALALHAAATAETTAFGGFDGAERVMLAFSDDAVERELFPITALDYSVFGDFDHRDVLGSILGLGLDRDRVGDILLFEGGFRVYVSTPSADFLTSELTRIGRSPAKVSPGAGEGRNLSVKFAPGSDTVASDRLDCIVAAVANCSRADAEERITRGLVAVNHLTIVKPTQPVDAGDVLSIRGKGKYRIDDLSGVSKKGRIILKYSTYL